MATCKTCGVPMLTEQPHVHRSRISTHWEDCWRVHHSCAIVLVERLQAALEPECEEFGCHEPLSDDTAEKPHTQ